MVFALDGDSTITKFVALLSVPLPGKRVKFAWVPHRQSLDLQKGQGGQNPGRRQAGAGNDVIHMAQRIRQLGCHCSLIVRQS